MNHENRPVRASKLWLWLWTLFRHENLSSKKMIFPGAVAFEIIYKIYKKNLK